MALGFYYAPAAMTARKYDECIRQLTKAGAPVILEVARVSLLTKPVKDAVRVGLAVP